ncbi:MAG: four helix bundle protein [Candidatus Peregrinibacteria bacterium]|nr:four helix bundle protein [Candidatus Peregrinibacteria bacterium]
MKPFDLQQRSLLFAQDVRSFARLLPRSVANMQDIRQLIRSSGSIGANYIEASDSLGKRDSIHKLRISRREAKESMYWLSLVDTGGRNELSSQRTQLVNEARELLCILSSMIRKCTGSP